MILHVTPGFLKYKVVSPDKRKDIKALFKQRIHCSEYKKGSIVVETSLALPLVLMALCALLSIGQILLIRYRMLYALDQASEAYVQQLIVRDTPEVAESAEIRLLFSQFFPAEELTEKYIAGGSHGVVVQAHKDADHIAVKGSCLITVPVPGYRGIRIPLELTIRKRLFTGYLLHEGESEDDGPIVYVAKYGTVYHRKRTCSSIFLQHNKPADLFVIMQSGRYDPCRECIKEDVTYSLLYTTKYGEAYHASIFCRGLKREIREVPVDEVGDLKPCSKCGGS